MPGSAEGAASGAASPGADGGEALAASLGEALLGRWVEFATELRAEGLALGPPAILAALRALAAIDWTQRADVKAAARACLVSRREDCAAFDRAFERFFSGRRRMEEVRAAPLEPSDSPQDPARRRDPRPDRGDEPELPAQQARASQKDVVVGLAYSPEEALRRKDFARWTPEERASLLQLLRRLQFRIERRPARRWRRLPRGRRGARLDLSRALRERLRRGELGALCWRERERRPRRLIVLCDVSGSMTPYARALLLLACALRARLPDLEAFVFATRLTRITPALRLRDADRALARIGEIARDFSGGTRIGAALLELDERWLRRLGGPRAVVLVLSDGLDRGDPALLESAIRRLARGCHRLLWLSPLLGVPGYRPETRGVRALLPHLDAFLPAHDLASLERLAALLARVSSLRAGSRDPQKAIPVG